MELLKKLFCLFTLAGIGALIGGATAIGATAGICIGGLTGILAINKLSFGGGSGSNTTSTTNNVKFSPQDDTEEKLGLRQRFIKGFKELFGISESETEEETPTEEPTNGDNPIENGGFSASNNTTNPDENTTPESNSTADNNDESVIILETGSRASNQTLIPARA